MTLNLFAHLPAAIRPGVMRLPAALLRIAALLLLSLAAVRPGLAHEFKIGDLTIGHPWSRAAPEGAKVAGGYLTIKNSGAEPDRLVSVTAEIAGSSEIHEMAVDDKGVMTMRELSQGLEIPAGGEAALTPGAMHIMFMQLNRLPVAGEKFAGTLTFEKAGTVKVEFKVEPLGGGDHQKHTDAATHESHTGG